MNLFDGDADRQHPQLDVSSRAFQPKGYIQKVLSNVSHKFFEGQLVDQVGEAEAETGEALKQLIRDNLGVFINSKDAMDAVYSSDTALFTGEALDGITNSFESATASCASLVQPITKSFMEVQQSRKSQDMLDRFVTVLGVPGAIYESCGVKVAQRRRMASEAAAMVDIDDEDTTTGHNGTHQADHEEDEDAGKEEEEEEEEDDEDEGERERSGDARRVAHTAHGTLERPGEFVSPAELYMLESSEEVFYWYGTPLVRLKDVDARRLHVEQASNYEAAVLHLRRAMLYVSETYSILDGTMLVGDGADSLRMEAAEAGAGEARGPTAGHASSSSPSPANDASGHVSGVGRSAFSFRLSLALLRAALYLCSQLAEELAYADPADTVLIEDTLSMMMDASIASAKLHHFCRKLKESIGQADRHDQVLTKLRTQLTSGGTAVSEGIQSRAMAAGGTGGKGNAAAPAESSSRAADDNTSTLALNNTLEGTSHATEAAAFQHPAHFFIKLVERQQKARFSSSAANIEREASNWLRKAQTEAERGVEERHRQRTSKTKQGAAMDGGGGLLSVEEGASTTVASPLLDNNATFGRGVASYSFLGGGASSEDAGFIGNINDSFVADGSFWGVGSSFERVIKGERSQQSSPMAPNNGKDGANSGAHSLSCENMRSMSLSREAYMTQLLDAFNTPETPFTTSSDLRVGSSDMNEVLVASCLQIRAHSSAILAQLFTRADVESAVMAQTGSLDSFALRLCAECVGALEDVVGSYWGGIATTLHAGVFDFTPEANSELHIILTELIGSRNEAMAVATAAGGATDTNDSRNGASGLLRSSSTMLGGTTAASSSPAGVQEDSDAVADLATAGAADAETSPLLRGASGGYRTADALPRVRFLPVLVPAVGEKESPGGGAVTPSPMCLRDLSVRAVRGMIAAAKTTLRELFVAFINRSVTDGLVGTLARYRSSDLSRCGRSERVELHAAVLYETILSQWERMMRRISDSVLRLKIVIGESSSSATISSERQAEEVGELLRELEQLRSSCLCCYLHGLGVLSKAYLAVLPLIQRQSDVALDVRVRSRLSRDSVSSSAVHKLLNVFSVVMDRFVPFITRDTEVYASVDLFAVKSENLQEDVDGDGGRVDGAEGGGRSFATSRRRTLHRRTRGEPLGDNGQGANDPGGARRASREAPPMVGSTPSMGSAQTVVDPISDLIATFHSGIVVESLQDHEELALALLSHLLLAFVDMLQLKCRTATTDADLHPDKREQCVVECMADTLCLATTLTPLFMEHLLTPCIFELVARQLPSLCPTPAAGAALVQSKIQQYSQVYLSVVEEHCQLAVDAMINTYLALAEQPITDLVRRQGFIQPLFDWQRVSPQTTGAVRPYLADALACIARARETLNTIRQPILGSAATQRLVAHLARTLLTSFSSDVNAFELSLECSSTFLVYGLTLLEAEVMTVLHVVDAVIAHVAAHPTTSELSAELAFARASLSSVGETLDRYASSVCEALVVARTSEADGGSGQASLSFPALSSSKRRERRDGMVQAALRTLRYMLEAINTELEESSLSSAAVLQLRSAAGTATKGGDASTTRSAVAERIVQRIEGRTEGYELRRARATAAAEDEKKRRQARLRSGQDRVTTDALQADGDTPADEKSSQGDRRRLLRRNPEASPSRPVTPSRDAEMVEGGATGECLTPRAARASELESSKAAEAANTVLQLAQDQRPARRVRKTRKAREGGDAAGGGGAPGAGDGDATEVPSGTGTLAQRAPLPEVSSSANSGGNGDDAGRRASGLAPTRAPRLARRRHINDGAGGDGNDDGDGIGGDAGAPVRHERRANRFRRSNAL